MKETLKSEQEERCERYGGLDRHNRHDRRKGYKTLEEQRAGRFPVTGQQHTVPMGRPVNLVSRSFSGPVHFVPADLWRFRSADGARYDHYWSAGLTGRPFGPIGGGNICRVLYDFADFVRCCEDLFPIQSRFEREDSLLAYYMGKYFQARNTAFNAAYIAGFMASFDTFGTANGAACGTEKAVVSWSRLKEFIRVWRRIKAETVADHLREWVPR